MNNPTRTGLVRISDYPELKILCWSIHSDEITEEEAFGIYKSNWRFAYENHMTQMEKQLVRQLTKKYGQGSKLLSE